MIQDLNKKKRLEWGWKYEEMPFVDFIYVDVALRGETASHGNFPAFPFDITDESASAQKYKVRKYFPVITSVGLL